MSISCPNSAALVSDCGKVDPASTCVYISLIRIWEQILTCSRRSVGQLIQFLVSMHSKYYYRFGATGDCPDELWTWLILLFQHYSVKAHLKTLSKSLAGSISVKTSGDSNLRVISWHKVTNTLYMYF